MDLKYGRRLSDDEYEAQLVALHSGLAPDLSAQEDADLRRRELELIIDHRLGTEFPKDRRLALWAVHQRLESRRLWMVVRLALKRAFLRGGGHAEQRVGREAFNAYASVLSAQEVEAFLGVREGAAAVLPRAGQHADE